MKNNYKFTQNLTNIHVSNERTIETKWPASVAVQAGLCRTCSETTLLVFPRGGS